MKKFLSLILMLAVVLSSMAVMAAPAFTDMGADHWAMPSVEKLVNEGTIRGYEDGSFRPDNTVTRAEFVKMIGKGTENGKEEFDDVDESHWGYEYIIYSGLKGNGNNFEPDRAITRGETVELLWRRAGGKTGVKAPEFVKEQLPYAKNAVSWIYSTGVMIGNDGYDLRLSDTLTRAEAAALIIKSRTSTAILNAVDLISADILKNAYNSSAAFDSAYAADGTITYGEMARAALRYATDSYYPAYNTYYSEVPFEHEYARDFFIMCNLVLGKDKITLENIDKPVTISDALKMLVAAVSRRVRGNFKYDIVLYNDDSALNKAATAKDIAAMLVQYDEFSGFSTVTSTAKKDDGTYSSKYVTSEKTVLPYNSDVYTLITEGVPTSVYEKAFKLAEGASGDDFGNPAKIFIFAKSYATMFMDQLSVLKEQAKTAMEIDVDFEYYPELVYNSGNGFTVRVKCVINNIGTTNYVTNDLFSESLITNVNEPLTNGMSFFVELTIPYSNFVG
ncbi:MAG: S-layer homology domain-containing protein [Clostridia bacterium]|nr:S-layer homology domain-containing protein [Clostridia bacterium]